MKTAHEIAKANIPTARARKEKLRVEFSLCFEVVTWMKKAGFENFRVNKMTEGNRTWTR